MSSYGWFEPRYSNEGGGNMSTVASPEVREGYFPHWKLKTTGVIMPEERLPWGPDELYLLWYC